MSSTPRDSRSTHSCSRGRWHRTLGVVVLVVVRCAAGAAMCLTRAPRSHESVPVNAAARAHAAPTTGAQRRTYRRYRIHFAVEAVVAASRRATPTHRASSAKRSTGFPCPNKASARPPPGRWRAAAPSSGGTADGCRLWSHTDSKSLRSSRNRCCAARRLWRRAKNGRQWRLSPSQHAPACRYQAHGCRNYRSLAFLPDPAPTVTSPSMTSTGFARD